MVPLPVLIIAMKVLVVAMTVLVVVVLILLTMSYVFVISKINMRLKVSFGNCIKKKIAEKAPREVQCALWNITKAYRLL